jgi:serine protease Do
VLTVSGKEVNPDQTLSYIVANTAPGSRIPIELIRDGRRMTVTAIVGKRPSEEELAQQTFDPSGAQADDPLSKAPKQQGQGLPEKALGLSVIPLSPQIARQLGATEDTQGLVVTVVDPSSDAGAKGLLRGDIILSANYRAINSIAALEETIRGAKASNRVAVLLRIQRRGVPASYVPVRLR